MKILILLKPVVILVLLLLYVCYFGLESLQRYGFRNLVTETYTIPKPLPLPVIILMSEDTWRDPASFENPRIADKTVNTTCGSKIGEELKICLENLATPDVDIFASSDRLRQQYGENLQNFHNYTKRYIYSPAVN